MQVTHCTWCNVPLIAHYVATTSPLRCLEMKARESPWTRAAGRQPGAVLQTQAGFVATYHTGAVGLG